VLEDTNAKTWRINRRDFLIGAAAMAGPTPLLAATAPKKGGTFRMGVISGDVAQNLDPTSTAGALDQMVQSSKINSSAPQIRKHGSNFTFIKRQNAIGGSRRDKFFEARERGLSQACLLPPR